MKPVTRYTLATVTLLLASCGQEEGKETPAVPGAQSSGNKRALIQQYK